MITQEWKKLWLHIALVDNRLFMRVMLHVYDDPNDKPENQLNFNKWKTVRQNKKDSALM